MASYVLKLGVMGLPTETRVCEQLGKCVLKVNLQKTHVFHLTNTHDYKCVWLKLDAPYREHTVNKGFHNQVYPSKQAEQAAGLAPVTEMDCRNLILGLHSGREDRLLMLSSNPHTHAHMHALNK